jgi:hypothetical protein
VNFGFRILILFGICGFAFVISASVAEAGLIVKALPSLGLIGGLVGHWSFDGASISSNNSAADSSDEGITAR